MSKRFLKEGQRELRDFEKEIQNLEEKLKASCKNLQSLMKEFPTSGNMPAKALKWNNELKDCWSMSTKLQNSIKSFQGKVSDKNQPLQKLHDAIVQAARQRPVEEIMVTLALDGK